MRTRWYLCDFRYLSISITLAGPDEESPGDLQVFVFDLSLRPLWTIHCASTWTGFGRCQNFVFPAPPLPASNFGLIISILAIYPSTRGSLTIPFYRFVITLGDRFLLT